MHGHAVEGGWAGENGAPGGWERGGDGICGGGVLTQREVQGDQAVDRHGAAEERFGDGLGHGEFCAENCDGGAQDLLFGL